MTKQIRALARGLAVINAIDKGTGPLTLGQIHDATGIDRATLLRILATLEQEEWVCRGIGDKSYRLTYKLKEVGERVNIHDAIAQIAQPVMSRLQQTLQWPSDISVYNGQSMEIIETTRKTIPFVLNREAIGYTPSMLRSAMGRAYLAFSDERQRQRIIKKLQQGCGQNGKLAKDPIALDKIFTETRQQGFAERDQNGRGLFDDFGKGIESIKSISAIAVPIIVLGDVQACINVVWITEAYEDPDIKFSFNRQLQPFAEELSVLFHENEIF